MKILSAVCVMLTLFAAFLVGGTWAQSDDNEQIWSTPISLYEMPTDSHSHTIVADSTGRVHAFWGESLEIQASTGNMIMYSYWDGQAWSSPTDIFIAPDGLEATAWKPAAAVSSNGQIHMVWVGGFSGNIYYGSARADEAMSAAAWSGPTRLIGGDSARIVIDNKGVIHVVTTTQTGLDQGIYYLRSEDQGQTWSNPELIPDTHLNPEVFIYNGRLAVGRDGTIHVAWWWSTADFPPDGVMYIRSIDNGQTWSDLLSMKGHLQHLNVATVGEQEVHLIWSSTTPERFKWYRWSSDGGRTWSPVAKWPQLGGFHGWTEMAVDSDGVLHLGMVSSHYGIQDRRNEVLLHMQWNGGRWSEPEIVLYNPPLKEENLKHAAIAISEGNLVHLLVKYPVAADQKRPYQYDIYYSRRRINSSYIPPQPLPTVTPIPSPTLALSPQPTATPAHLPTREVFTNPPPSSTSNLTTSPAFAILVGVGPVLVIVIAVVLIRFGQLERK